jgi:hypothetical protein
MAVKIVGVAATAPDDAIRKSELDAAIAGIPPGSASWTAVEVDFGSEPVWDKTFTITDAGVTALSDVAVVPSGRIATGRVGNDAAWDNLLLAATPAAGSFELTALAVPGPVVGRRIVQYQIG